MPGQVIRVPFRDSSDDDAEQVTTIHILNDYHEEEDANTRYNRLPYGVELTEQQPRRSLPQESATTAAATIEQPSRFRQFCNRVAGTIANSITRGMTNDIIQQSHTMLSPRHDMFDDESSTETGGNSFYNNNNNINSNNNINTTFEENSEREWAVDTEHEHNAYYDNNNRQVNINATTNGNLPFGSHPNMINNNNNNNNYHYGEAPVMTTNVPYELHDVSEANPCNYEAVQSVTNTEDENVDIDLRETIQQYVETGLDFYYNIILVTLKYNTRPITSEVFSAARGNPLLIMTLLNIGTVDENDPIVREIVQEEVDRIVDVGKPVCTAKSECSSNDLNSHDDALHHHHHHHLSANNNNSNNNNTLRNYNNICNTTDASNNMSIVVNVASHNEFISAKHVEYLRALCQVKTVRLTLRQIALLRFSGFEYIKILTDYPHLWKDVPRPSLAMSAAMRVMLLIRFIVSWMGILASMVFLGATVWVVTFWFRQNGQSENGYWTILCWVVAYVMSIIWTARVEEDKIVQYDEQIWSYPDYKFKFIPAIPAYDFLLLMTALRYKLQRDAKRYLVIDYDLRNGIGLQQIIHGLFTVAPQVVLQLYLLTRGNHNTIRGFPYPFRLLIASGIICYCFSLFSFLVIVTSAHSCTTFGFARMTISELQGKRQWLLVTHVLTRELHFFLVYFSVVVCMSLFIFLLNTADCAASDKTILSVYIGVVVICDVVLVYILIYKPPARVYGIIALPVIAMEIARLVYAKVQSRDDPFHLRRCLLVDRIDTVWTIPIFVTFGGLCVYFLLWCAAVMYELITNKEIKQRLADNLLFLWI